MNTGTDLSLPVVSACYCMWLCCAKTLEHTLLKLGNQPTSQERYWYVCGEFGYRVNLQDFLLLV